MIITCEQCHARFRLADEKIKIGGTKVRCSKCKHIFLVLPPEPRPAEETVESVPLSGERVAGEETSPAPTEPPTASAGEFPAASPPEPPAVPPSGPPTDEDESPRDDSGLDQSMGTGTGGERVDEFSYAATDGSAPAIAAQEEPAGFTFEDDMAEPAAEAPADESAAFTFEPGSVAAIGEEFSFEGAQTDAPESGFRLDDETDENAFAFGNEPAGVEGAAGLSFDTQVSPDPSPFEAESPFGEESATTWSLPDAAEGPSFDFDEPSFESRAEGKPLKRSDDAGLSFGEIDFTDEGGKEPPSFGPEPDFSQAALPRLAEPEAPPPPRPSAIRPHNGEPMAAPTPPGRNPMSRFLLLLVLMLLLLCVAGGYFYFMGNGQQVIDQLLLKLKGEDVVAQVEQRIGLNIEGSSYVDNRDAGQLLVIQGSTTNNFSGSRSSITVKGQLLDAGGKVLQQQTVFCGNYLGEEKLQTMTYAQIEEAMNNEFGDSLANMNVKPGSTIRFTIVFRNVPKEMANINVEVVDSKAGGL